jgi:mono/diheme cytochrome c family protein
MTRRLLMNSSLFVVLVALIGFNWWASPDASRPNFEILPQMAHSARYNAYAGNPNFWDGKTLQPPVPGTIARGTMPLHYTAAPADALRAGQELMAPGDSHDPRALARGEHVFKTFCTPCHGVDAGGMGTVTTRGVPPPPSLLAPHAVDMKDGQMFHVLTYGQNNMASYAGQVTRNDRWYVIAYIRSLQAAAQKSAPGAAPVVKTAAAPPADAGKGGAK